jgi:hypothetical protein
MRPSSRKTLDALAASMKPGAFRALIADIRAAKELELLPPAKGAYKSTRRPPADPLTAEVTALLAPILARSAEKAHMLVDHLSELTGRRLDVPAGGLAPAIRALRKHLSDEDIRNGAFGLRVKVHREHSLVEKVK